MASNFYEAGLEYLLTQTSGIFDQDEVAVLSYLHEAASESEAVYWDRISNIMVPSPINFVIIGIKRKCRYLKMHEVFEHLYFEYRGHPFSGFKEAA